MSIPGVHVNVLNRAKTGKKGKTMAGKTPPRGKDGKFKKGGRRGGKKKRSGNPSGGGGGKKKKKRRSNPNGGGGGGGMTLWSATKQIWPRVLGKLWVVWAVRRFGGITGWGSGSLFSTQEYHSPFRGRSWTIGNYIVGYLALKLAAQMLAKSGRGRAWAREFFQGGFDSLATRLLWTEAFARSPWMQEQFGQVQGQTYRDPSTGQTYMFWDGQYQAMQGAEHGQLVEATAMDGMGQLVEASAMDGADGFGQLVDATALDGFGQQMPRGTPQSEAIAAAYQQTGGVDPYATAYQG